MQDSDVKELIAQINLEAQDAAAQGDRVGAAILQRFSNAFHRFSERRNAHLAEQPGE